MTGRPLLSSRHRRVSRTEQAKKLAPWLAVVDSSTGCTYTSVIPADVLPAPKRITVNVYNSTKRVGLASITSIDLKTRGFKIGTVGSSSANLAGIAVIRYGSGARPEAERLAAYVPGALLKHIARSNPDDHSVDLVIGPAFGTIAPNEQAAAILAIPSAQASGSGCPKL